MDRTELMKKSAEGEELNEQEATQLQRYLAELMEKTQIDYKEIEKIMFRGVPKDERREAEPVRTSLKIGRNEPCPCESGKKYKKCCGAGKPVA